MYGQAILISIATARNGAIPRTPNKKGEYNTARSPAEPPGGSVPLHSRELPKVWPPPPPLLRRSWPTKAVFSSRRRARCQVLDVADGKNKRGEKKRKKALEGELWVCIARAPALHASLFRLFREPFRTLHRLIHRLAVEPYMSHVLTG